MSYHVPDTGRFPFCPTCHKPTLSPDRDAAGISDQFFSVHCTLCGHTDAVFHGLAAAGFPNALFVSQTITR